MTARTTVPSAVLLLGVAGALDGTDGVIAVLYVAGFVAILALLVHGIDRLDRWARTAHPEMRIDPEQPRVFTYPDRDADVVQLRSEWGAR